MSYFKAPIVPFTGVFQLFCLKLMPIHSSLQKFNFPSLDPHQVAPRFRRPWPYRKHNIVLKIFKEVFSEPTEIPI
jgi:hypothetical protein